MQINESLRKKFMDWIEEGTEGQGWSLRELARRADISQAHISNVKDGKRSVTWDLVAHLAKAFCQTPESAFRRVGLLPPHSVRLEELQEVMAHLSDAQVKEVIGYAEWKRKEAEKPPQAIDDGKNGKGQ